MTGHNSTSAAFIREIIAEFPAFRIVAKSQSPLSKLIDLLLKVVTAGGQRRYMTEYHTVIGNTLYVPETWQDMADSSKLILLRHERVHLRQRARLTLPLMAFLYLVPFFPLGLAYGRARLEWEAYEETLRATAELRGIQAARSAELRQQILDRFTGADYGWMWPFRRQVGTWYDAALRRLEAAPHRPPDR